MINLNAQEYAQYLFNQGFSAITNGQEVVNRCKRYNRSYEYILEVLNELEELEYLTEQGGK